MSALSVQIKREFWEHRSLWIAPAAIAALLLLASVMAGGARGLHVDVDGNPADLSSMPLFDYLVLACAAPLYLTAIVLASLYLLDCLYAERRDRSVLFWRSMPVSDTRTVLVKLLVGLVVVPVGVFVLAAVMSLAVSAVLALRQPIGALSLSHWSALSWLRLQGSLLYSMLAVLLWYAPYAAYLMLASAWARRTPAAWAAIPPLVLLMFEPMIFGTHYLSHLMRRSFNELLGLIFHPAGGQGLSADDFVRSSVASHAHFIDPTPLLTSPKLWLGLAAAALMLAIAIYLRRYREE
jgi:ABC-2 type transport system permease protein